MLGEQFRNVNIVPQVITVMKAKAQTPGLREETAWTHWKKAKITVELQMKSRAFANRLGKPKNSDLPAEINYYLCMHKRKKGKKNLTRTDQSAVVFCDGKIEVTLQFAPAWLV